MWRPTLTRFRLVILHGFSRFQRPIAWAVLIGGAASFCAVAANIIATGDAKLATLLGALVLTAEGLDMAQSIENEIDSEGAAEGGD